MNSKIKKFLLCFSILGMLFTSLPTSNYEVMAKEVQQSQEKEEVEEDSIEVNETSIDTPAQNIKTYR